MHYIVPGSWLICMVIRLAKRDHADGAHVDLRNRRKHGASTHKGAGYKSRLGLCIIHHICIDLISHSKTFWMKLNKSIWPWTT